MIGSPRGCGCDQLAARSRGKRQVYVDREAVRITSEAEGWLEARARRREVNEERACLVRDHMIALLTFVLLHSGYLSATLKPIGGRSTVYACDCVTTERC